MTSDPASALLHPRALERFTESFHSEGAVQHVGGVLGPHNVLDYFAESPFYDRKCNNELVRRQNIRDAVAFRDALRQMQGLEYQLVAHQEPRLFVIVRQRRSSEALVAKEAVYYVLDNVVYQAPNLEELIVSRARKITDHLMRAIELLRHDASPPALREVKTFSSLAQAKTTLEDLHKQHKRLRVVDEALEALGELGKGKGKEVEAERRGSSAGADSS